MGKKYVSVPNETRQEIIRLINEDGKTIAEASKATGVYYPTVKAIQKVYAKTGRINRIEHWKLKTKRKRGKRRDQEHVYANSSSFEPNSSDICDGSASRELPSKSEDINSPADVATPSANQDPASNQR